MALEAFKGPIWSNAILLTLQKAHVLVALCNTNYEGDISDYGDSVKITSLGAVTVSSYVEHVTTISPQVMGSASKDLKIDQQKYFAFGVGDIEKAQARPDVFEGSMTEAAYRLRDAADTYVGTLYTEGQITSGLGTEATPIDVTSLNTIEYLSLTSQKMSEANVPMEGRYMAITPWFEAKITLADITLNTNNSETMSNGFVGRAMGFNFYMSNNVSVGTPSTNAKTRLMAGYPGSITFASQLLKMEAYRPESSFKDALKGLYTYGAKAGRPESLAVLRADYTAEP